MTAFVAGIRARYRMPGSGQVFSGDRCQMPGSGQVFSGDRCQVPCVRCQGHVPDAEYHTSRLDARCQRLLPPYPLTLTLTLTLTLIRTEGAKGDVNHDIARYAAQIGLQIE